MAFREEATILLAATSDARPLACNRTALDLLGCDERAFDALDVAALRTLTTPGRHDLVRPDGATVTVEVGRVERWWASGPAQLVVAREVDAERIAPPPLLLDRLLDALDEHEAGRGSGLALLFVDPGEGEAVDPAVEALLRAAVRRSDLVTSLAEGFAVLCQPVHGEIDAAGLAATLVDELSLLAPRVSMGVALPGDPGMTVAALRDDADAALAAARTQGRARHAAFTAAAQVRSRRQAVAARSLRRALDGGELDVHYQPVVDLTDGRVRAVEALARWLPPGRSPIPPDRFIPVAERSGLIGELGEWVLRHACEFAAGEAGVRVAVNLSPRQVDEELAPKVAAVLDATGAEADQLELELTESALLDDPATAADVLRSVTDLGVRLALDDFGTGYSSLVVLRRLPFDRLKIDRSFVRSVAETPADRELVAAVVGLARAVGVAVTAEGVETASQVEVLSGLGCDDAQGYHFAPPMPATECRRWLARR